MALLDILSGQRGSGGRVPPLATALMGLLAYNKLKTSGEAAPGGQPAFAERLEDFFKPAAGGGPTAKGVIGALLTGGMMDLVNQFRGAGKADRRGIVGRPRAQPGRVAERSLQGVDGGADRFPVRTHRHVARRASGRPQRAPASGGGRAHARRARADERGDGAKSLRIDACAGPILRGRRPGALVVEQLAAGAACSSGDSFGSSTVQVGADRHAALHRRAARPAPRTSA